MKSRWEFLKLWKLVQRENAARYMLISLLSFVATVTLVRTFLSLTGYPQIGTGTLHIAHVVWGGLILYIASVFLLIYHNPNLHYLGSVLSGVGVGLFIDEVGKFITREYDYFFPSAAPIMYVFFLLVVILVVMINRPEEVDGRTELVQALEIVHIALYRPLDAIERQHFEQDMKRVIESDPNLVHVDMARYFLQFVRANEQPVLEAPPTWWMRLSSRFLSWLTERRLRRLLTVGLFILALISLKNPLLAWLNTVMPGSLFVDFLRASYGRQIPSMDAPGLFTARLILEVLVSLLLLITISLLLTRQRRLAINLAYLSLLMSLTILDMLLFYFEQFSTVLDVGFQFILLFGIMYYRRKYLQSGSTI